jgi:hypothetical protein
MRIRAYMAADRRVSNSLGLAVQLVMRAADMRRLAGGVLAVGLGGVTGSDMRGDMPVGPGMARKMAVRRFARGRM